MIRSYTCLILYIDNEYINIIMHELNKQYQRNSGSGYTFLLVFSDFLRCWDGGPALILSIIFYLWVKNRFIMNDAAVIDTSRNTTSPHIIKMMRKTLVSRVYQPVSIICNRSTIRNMRLIKKVATKTINYLVFFLIFYAT